MGNSHPSDQQLLQYQNQSQFSNSQIRQIYKHFQSLDHTNKGYVSCQDLVNQAGFNDCLLGDRFVKGLQQSEYNPEIDFVQFMKALSSICSDDPVEKERVLFKYYDFDEDGLVGTEDVSMMLLLMGGNPDTCNLMASYLLQQFDGDKDGKLNFTEFQTFLLSQM